MAAGLLLGATTSLGDGFGLAASWMTIFGLGLGLTLPAAMDAAIGGMPAERAGMGSGLLMSLRMVGGAIGVAVLGSLVNSVYRGDLEVRALSPASAAGVRDGVATGVRVARALRSPALLDSVQAAFVHGMDVMLVACAAIAVLGAVLGVRFLPNRAGAAESTTDPAGQPIGGSGESRDDAVRTA